MQPDDTRRTFVLWLSRERAARAGHSGVQMDARVEDIDTGREFRFHSLEQLIAFLQESMEQK